MWAGLDLLQSPHLPICLFFETQVGFFFLYPATTDACRLREYWIWFNHFLCAREYHFFIRIQILLIIPISFSSEIITAVYQHCTSSNKSMASLMQRRENHNHSVCWEKCHFWNLIPTLGLQKVWLNLQQNLHLWKARDMSTFPICNPVRKDLRSSGVQLLFIISSCLHRKHLSSTINPAMYLTHS